MEKWRNKKGVKSIKEVGGREGIKTIEGIEVLKRMKGMNNSYNQ